MTDEESDALYIFLLSSSVLTAAKSLVNPPSPKGKAKATFAFKRTAREVGPYKIYRGFAIYLL